VSAANDDSSVTMGQLQIADDADGRTTEPAGAGEPVQPDHRQPRRGGFRRLLGSELRLVFRRKRNLALLAVLAGPPILIGLAVRASAPRPGEGPNFLGQITGNGLYTGAIGEYNSVILRSSFNVTNGVSNAGATVANTYRSVLLGGQAAMIAFGQKDTPGKYRWNEELFDHKRRMEVSAWTIHGLRKTKFNNLDYGTIVCSTYAVAHT